MQPYLSQNQEDLHQADWLLNRVSESSSNTRGLWIFLDHQIDLNFDDLIIFLNANGLATYL